MLPGAGMYKAPPPGVEALSLQPFLRRGGAVSEIPQKRVADAGHVYPDLMGAAGLQAAENVGVAPVGGQQLPVCDSRLGILIRDGHTLAVDGVAAYGFVDGTAVLLEIAADNGLVLPAKTVICQLGRQSLMGKVVFGHDPPAGGVLINAVDDAGPALAANARETVSAMIQ